MKFTECTECLELVDVELDPGHIKLDKQGNIVCNDILECVETGDLWEDYENSDTTLGFEAWCLEVHGIEDIYS